MTDQGVVCALPDRSAMAEVSKYQDPLVISGIMHTARTIAIVGLSSNVLRPSNFVGFYVQRHGYTIVPVNPNEREVLGQKAYANLTEIPFHVDVVVDRCMKVEHARHMGRMHWLGFNTGVVGSQRQSVL